MRSELPPILLLSSLLVACGPQLSRPSVSSHLVGQERIKQEQLAAELRLERKIRLFNVMDRLLFNAKDFCERGCTRSVELVEKDNVNAFTDGIKIGITNGMMRFVKDDDELAIVLAHELAHEALGHMGKQTGNVLLGTLMGAALDIGAAAAGVNTGGAGTKLGQDMGKLAFSQEFEMEADYLALYFAARSGFDISKAPDLMRRMAIEHPASIKENFLATHPSGPERVAGLETVIAEIKDKLKKEEPLTPLSLERPAGREGQKEEDEIVSPE